MYGTTPDAVNNPSYLHRGYNQSYTIVAQLNNMNNTGEKVMSVKLPSSLIKDLYKAVNEDGIFLSVSDALRYGARLALLLTRGTKTLEELRKEARDKL